jgi:hypothetical protein
MRIVCSVMTALFLLAIVVQYNDPDPIPWMLAYALPTLLSGVAAFGRLPGGIAGAVGLAYAVAASLWLPILANASMSAFTTIGMQSQHDEEVREGLGLVLAAAWLLFLSAWTLRRAGPGPEHERHPQQETGP